MKRLLLAAVLCCVAAPIHGQGAADRKAVYELAEVESPPRPTNLHDLRAALRAGYPLALLQAGTGGRVMLSVVVGADGAVREPRVLSSTDPAFDGPSLAAVSVLRFTPGARGGSPVATRVEMPITWQAPPPAARDAAITAAAPAPAAVQSAGATMDREDPEPVTYELDVVERMPEIRNQSEISRAMRRLYPPGARLQRATADVVVRFRVGSDGVPGNFNVVRSSDRRFDQPSIEALSGARFRPAQVDGRDVPAWAVLPLHWELP